MLIRKKPARPHALGEPMLHEDHPLPVTRRQLLSAGLISAPAVVMAPAWLGALLRSGTANAANPTLSPDIAALLSQGQCNVPTQATGVPFICFDLAGGANLVGSEVLVGVQGGQSNFLSTAGFGKLGVPGNQVPGANSAFVDSSLGLLWHSDGAIKRGIMTKATTAATAAGTNGAVFCAMSQNDTQNNPHNPMYGIAKAGAQGLLLTLTGTQSSVSGGNSQAPMALIDPALQPTTISQPSDATALVDTGGATADPVAVAVLESQTRISGGSTPYVAGDTSTITGALTAPSGSTPGVSIYTDPTTDTQLKNQVRCAYVKSANTAAVFGNPAALDPTQDPLIIGGTSPIFTASDFQDGDIRKTATVMKLVLDGYAGAGTISLGGYDYHDSTRATGEMRNFKAGQMIGAVLEYAQRKQTPVMIYVFSDGSLSSTGMPDNSVDGRGKYGWQGDNSSVSSTFFLAYSPKGRPTLRNGTAGQQIGYFTADGSVVGTSSPVANSVNSLVQAVILNYMGLMGTDAQFPTLMQSLGISQGLGSAASLASLTAFNAIV
ncbi:MAG: general secretion pathway protein GspF [Proteobacteria bacterium]|nr:general secretion pathway protein GspF [Pseudomonadota bacterium]